MSDNCSPLQRNTLDGLSEMAGCLYMKLLDVFQAHTSAANERRAFLAACDFDEKVGAPLDYILRHAPIPFLNGETITSLSHFFAERWRHNFMDTPNAD